MPNYVQLDEIGTPTAKLFGERLKQRRQALGLTQAQLGKLTGTTSAYISFIERGQGNPTLDMMVKLADAVASEAWDLIRPDNNAK